MSIKERIIECQQFRSLKVRSRRNKELNIKRCLINAGDTILSEEEYQKEYDRIYSELKAQGHSDDDAKILTERMIRLRGQHHFRPPKN
jgi:hypothetical protein